MKTDSLFYRLFQRAPTLVFELAGLEVPVTGAYQFRAEEIKQTAFRLDGLLVPSPEQPDAPVVFVEVQFYRLKVMTVIHHFDLKRTDGTTAAERWFRTSFPDLFDWIVARMTPWPVPRKSRTPAKFNPLKLITVPA